MKVFLRWLRWIFLVLVVQTGCLFLSVYYKSEFATNLVIFFSWFYLICSIGMYIGAEKMEDFFNRTPTLLQRLDLIYDVLFAVVLIGLGWWFTAIAYVVATCLSELSLAKHLEFLRDKD